MGRICGLEGLGLVSGQGLGGSRVLSIPQSPAAVSVLAGVCVPAQHKGGQAGQRESSSSARSWELLMGWLELCLPGCGS